MKLLRSLTVAGVYAGWPDKFENIKDEDETKASTLADACRTEMLSAQERFSIENGFWGSCEGFDSEVNQMKCKSKCNSGTLNTSKGKAEIRVKCRDPPQVITKFFDEDDDLKCEVQPDECADEIEELNIIKGRLELISSGKKGNKYNLVCDNGAIAGEVKCKNGQISSKLDDFETACDRFVCDANDASDEFPIGAGTWNCKTKNGKLTCKGACNASGQIRFQAKCDPARGWFIHKPQFSEDFCEPEETTEPPPPTPPPVTFPPPPGFEPIVDTIQSGLELCSAAQNFPGASSRNVESSKIVGGIDADNNAWPFIVRFKINNLYICGGVVVHNHWVLTAGHCCQNSVREMKATFGDRLKNSVDSNEYTLDAAEWFRHPLWGDTSDGTGGNQDWCMVKFNEDIIASDPDDLVGIPCLPDTNPLPAQHGKACWLAGWGRNDEGVLPDILQSTGINVLSQEYCIEKGNKDFLELDDICAAVPDMDGDGDTDGGKDSCAGDSGGPLICPVDGKAMLIGVVSRAIGCALEGYPGLNSSTFVAREWMAGIIRNNS